MYNIGSRIFFKVFTCWKMGKYIPKYYIHSLAFFPTVYISHQFLSTSHFFKLLLLLLTSHYVKLYIAHFKITHSAFYSKKIIYSITHSLLPTIMESLPEWVNVPEMKYKNKTNTNLKEDRKLWIMHKNLHNREMFC